MLKKTFFIIVLINFITFGGVFAGTDGELILKKNDPAKVKDCFEKLNRATFALNQGLDKIIFE